MNHRWLWLAFAVGVVLWLVPSVYGQWQVFEGVSSRPLQLVADDGTQLAARAYWPADARGPLPGVVVAHGFCGSLEMMQHYALGLARVGFYVVSLDMRGHGASGGHLQAAGPGTMRSAYLDRDIAAAIDYMQAHPQEVAFHPKANGSTLPFRAGVAVLGHSMGGGAVVEAGLADKRIVAVVGVASAHTGAGVNATLPPNLLLAVGTQDSLVPPSGSLALLRSATGDADAVPGALHGDFAQGTARRMLLSLGSGHVEEVWDPVIISASVQWVEQAFGLDPTAYEPAPLRASVTCLYVSMAGMVVVLACVPLGAVWLVDRLLELPRGPEPPAGRGPRWRGAAVYLAVGVAGGLLGLPLGFALSAFPMALGGLLTGLYLAWAALAMLALVWLRRRGGVTPLGALVGGRRGAGFGVAAALVAFAAVYLLFYVTLGIGFLDSTPTPLRWGVIAALSVAFFPLTLADGWLLWGAALARPRGGRARRAAEGAALYAAAKLGLFAVGVAVAGSFFFFLFAFVAAVALVQAVVGPALWARAPTVAGFAAFNAIWLAYVVGGILPFMAG